MIIQSSNKPIIIELDTDISAATAVEVSIYSNGGLLQHWSLGDAAMTVASNVIQINVTQEETAKYPKGKARLYIKAMLNKQTEFWDEVLEEVAPFPDHTKMVVD